MKPRLLALAAIFGVLLAVVLRGRGNGPVPLAVAVKTATNGSFYHWQEFDRTGSVRLLRAEGWCAQRRSRTLYGMRSGDEIAEERRSPAGVYQRTQSGRASFKARTDVTGMEVGNDFLTHAAARLSGLDARLVPLGGGHWRAGDVIYTLEPRTARILAIDAPSEWITMDYPLALSSDLFEAPR